MTIQQLRELEAIARLPRRKTPEALASQVKEEMVTWTGLQREIDQRSQLEEIDLDWEWRRDAARQHEDEREEGELSW